MHSTSIQRVLTVSVLLRHLKAACRFLVTKYPDTLPSVMATEGEVPPRYTIKLRMLHDLNPLKTCNADLSGFDLCDLWPVPRQECGPPSKQRPAFDSKCSDSSQADEYRSFAFVKFRRLTATCTSREPHNPNVSARAVFHDTKQKRLNAPSEA